MCLTPREKKQGEPAIITRDGDGIYLSTFIVVFLLVVVGFFFCVCVFFLSKSIKIIFLQGDFQIRRHFISAPKFQPAVIKCIPTAGQGLCSWVRAAGAGCGVAKGTGCVLRAFFCIKLSSCKISVGKSL